MNIKSIPVLASLHERMAWLGKRQSVLAENIANANTPGYRARDLIPPDFNALARTAARSFSMARTNAQHLSEGTRQTTNFKTAEQKTDTMSISGNSVRVEDELMKVGETRLDFEVALTLYRKHMQILNQVIRGRGSG